MSDRRCQNCLNPEWASTIIYKKDFNDCVIFSPTWTGLLFAFFQPFFAISRDMMLKSQKGPLHRFFAPFDPYTEIFSETKIFASISYLFLLSCTFLTFGYVKPFKIFFCGMKSLQIIYSLQTTISVYKTYITAKKFCSECEFYFTIFVISDFEFRVWV